MTPLIVFIHIPRAGGTSFTRLLGDVYGEDLLSSQPVSWWPQEWPPQFFAEIKDRGNEIAAFSGMAAYGAHVHFNRPTFYTSIVRDPLCRFGSYYRFVRRHPQHRNHQAANELGIEDFFWLLDSQEDIELYNLQCLMLSNERSFQTAKTYVDDRIGLTIPLSRLTEGIDALGQSFFWQNWPYPHLKATKLGASVNEMSEKAQQKFLAGNAEDCALFEYSKEIFDQRVQELTDRTVSRAAPVPEKEKSKVFYFHIPKCAGMSVWNALWDQFGQENVLQVGVKEQRVQFQEMDGDVAGDYDAIGGHGWLSRYRHKLGNMEQYYKITTLRHPYDRIVSAYNFISHLETHHQHEMVREQTFEEFAEGEMQNMMCRLLTGTNDYRNAIDVLENWFDDFCYLEDLDGLVGRLQKHFGQQGSDVDHKNKSKKIHTLDDISKRALSIMEERNYADLRLYEHYKGKRR